jgi:2'-5' RNA ligase
MPRLRLGVALLLPPDVTAEIDGLRRALGDGALDRVPAHLTLVPPVNVRAEELGAALNVLQSAAAAVEAPITLRLGPVATFHPDTPVLYLSVGGDLDELHRLRERVFVPPLARLLTWPFVPHVTLADEIDPERIPAALAALADFEVEVELDRVVLLREGAGRNWAPAADVPFGPPLVVGRGGLPVTLWTTRFGDLEVADLFRSADAGDGEAAPLADGAESVIVIARRDGVLLGAARGWRRDGRTHLEEVRLTEAAGVEDIERHLRTAAARAT